MKPNNDTFCILPFTMMSTTNSGNFRTCCEGSTLDIDATKTSPEELWNSQFYKNLRLDLVNGVKNSNCNNCWKWEGKGGHSTRLNKNANVNENEIANLFKEFDHKTGYLSTYPELFEFKLGNLCNLKCIMCTQMESSQHQTEVKKIQNNFKEDLPALLNYIEQNFNPKKEIYQFDDDDKKKLVNNFLRVVPFLRTIKFVGGEPLINPMTFEILQCIYDDNNEDIDIEIITNLSDLDNKKLTLLSKFPNLNLILSYDSANKDVFEYIRYPADYKQFRKNLFKLLTVFNGKLSFSITINIFNIFDLEDILEDLEKLNKLCFVYPMINVVMDPKYFSVSYLPAAAKKQSIRSIENVLKNITNFSIFENNTKIMSQIQGVKNLLEDFSDDYDLVRSEQLRVLKLYNKVRSQNYLTIFPYLYQ